MSRLWESRRPPGGPDLKLGLFGGTFDPPHSAHVAAACCVLDRFGLDRVELVPASIPPHKPGRPLSSPFHRYAMTVLATLGRPGLAASHRELGRGGVSYAIETLREVRSDLPDARIFFILGTDQFMDIASWRHPQAIVGEFELIVLARPGWTFGAAWDSQPAFVKAAHDAGRIHRTDLEPIDLSATKIRELVRAGEPITGLVDPDVEHYIDRYGLYRTGG